MKKKKKDEGFFDEDDLKDCRRFIAGLVAGLFTTVLVLAFVVFAKRIFLLGGAASFTLVQQLQRIQVLFVDATVRWGKEFQTKIACIFEELYE